MNVLQNTAKIDIIGDYKWTGIYLKIINVQIGQNLRSVLNTVQKSFLTFSLACSLVPLYNKVIIYKNIMHPSMPFPISSTIIFLIRRKVEWFDGRGAK